MRTLARMLHTPDTISTLRHLLTACRTIAVVGLSPQWHRPSYFAAKYMQAHGYRIVPVNPLVAREGGQILGETAYASVTEAAAALAAQGQLIYAGGIDSIPSARPADIEKATNYVKVGLAEALAGKPISAATTAPYGCSIKYKSPA